MNMFKILLELDKQGFDGCVNPDHIPAIEGDAANRSQGMAYSIGYIKALFAALAVVRG
jgi:mannonate dehydratase